jgi:hypothetical protein
MKSNAYKEANYLSVSAINVLSVLNVLNVLNVQLSFSLA